MLPNAGAHSVSAIVTNERKYKERYCLSVVRFPSVMQFRSPVSLKRTGHYVHRQVYRSQILRSAHTVYLCVLCGSENKQRLFPYTTLTDWFV